MSLMVHWTSVLVKSLCKVAAGGAIADFRLRHTWGACDLSCCVSHLKVWTSGTSLRLWPRILWTSLAAARILFSTRFSCSCSSRVWTGSPSETLSSDTGSGGTVWGLTPRRTLTHLFLRLFEEEAEAFVFLDPGGQLPLAQLSRLLQLRLQLPQNPQLLGQPGLSRPGHLQVQLQVHGRPQEPVQTFDLHRGLQRGEDNQCELKQRRHMWHSQKGWRKRTIQKRRRRRGGGGEEQEEEEEEMKEEGDRYRKVVSTFFMRMLRLSEAFLTNGDFLESVELSLSLRFIWQEKKKTETVMFHFCWWLHRWLHRCLRHSAGVSPCRCTGSEVRGRRSWSGWWCSPSGTGSAGGRPGAALWAGPRSSGGTRTNRVHLSPCSPGARRHSSEEEDEEQLKVLFILQIITSMSPFVLLNLKV